MSPPTLLDGSISIPDVVEGVLIRPAVRDRNRLGRLLGVTLGCTLALAGLFHLSENADSSNGMGLRSPAAGVTQEGVTQAGATQSSISTRSHCGPEVALL